ncbi:MAG: hypothetical protein FJ147_15780 [Deltaproteobacteria bacterium]|nr:hypothetical protein [Deltaproteobacteria bacterium]
MSKAILTTIPNNQDTDSLLELAVEQSPEGAPCVTLRHLSWAEGLGWYPQQPLRLSVDEAEALLHALRTTRHLWQEQRQQKPGKIIPLPAISPGEC